LRSFLAALTALILYGFIAAAFPFFDRVTAAHRAPYRSQYIDFYRLRKGLDLL
jgi:hypothetical protein